MWLSLVSVGRQCWSYPNDGARSPNSKVDASRSIASELSNGAPRRIMFTRVTAVKMNGSREWEMGGTCTRTRTCTRTIVSNLFLIIFFLLRTIPVAERFFTSLTSVTLRQAAWYPSETEEPHLVLLTSDNTIRYSREPWARGNSMNKEICNRRVRCFWPEDLKDIYHLVGTYLSIYLFTYLFILSNMYSRKFHWCDFAVRNQKTVLKQNNL